MVAVFNPSKPEVLSHTSHPTGVSVFVGRGFGVYRVSARARLALAAPTAKQVSGTSEACCARSCCGLVHAAQASRERAAVLALSKLGHAWTLPLIWQLHHCSQQPP